jgi:ABC-2 type transport system permease protein
MTFSPRRLAAVARKEFLHVVRDWRSLTLALAIPVLLVCLFGYALTMDLNHVPTAVWDQSGTPQSRELIGLLQGSAYFDIRRTPSNYRQITDALDRREVMVAVVIPADFSRRLLAGQTAAVQAMVDGSDANNANLAAGYLHALTQLYNRKIMVQRLEHRGITPVDPTVTAEMRAWYNPDLRSVNVIVPGIIALVMAVIAAMLTSVTVAREWEMGTMEQLISTPLRVPELVIGKVIPYFGVGLADVGLAVVMGHFVFQVPIRGNAALLFAIASVFLGGVLFFGMMLSIALKSQVLANQLALFATYLPTLLLSGFVFSIHNMPPPIQIITYIVPARYFIAAMRGIFLKGIGLEILWINVLLLLLYTALMVLVAHRKLRFKLEA